MNIAFIGHRKIERTKTLKDRLTQLVEKLIVKDGADTFLFGSRSEFNDLCYEVVTELQDEFEHIRRIFIRAEYEYIDKPYYEYLLSLYEDTFYPAQVHGAGKLSYVKRNQVMIDMCDLLVAYCDKGYEPTAKTNSGTKIAVDYARKKNKTVINLFESKIE